MSDIFVDAEKVKNLVKEIFVRLDVPEGDAEVVADNLVAADLRGIRSHGVARLERYVRGIREGVIKPKTEVKIVSEGPSVATVSGGDGLGQVASKFAMELAIQKAEQTGAGFVSVRDSNHYGIAAYYSMMALEKDMIGISMTNTAPLVVPTFARDAFIGTNPISITAPSNREWPFVLDMATSAVPRGKIEVYNREEKKLPLGWATDETGRSTDDPGRVLRNLIERKGGGLLPLGGEGELHGGHKGYGLSVAVDILSGVLSGGAYGNHTYEKKGQPANVCHFFGALDVKRFIDIDLFKKLLDSYMSELKGLNKAEGATRIYVHGEKEFEAEARFKEKGIPLHEKTVKMIREIASSVGLNAEFLGE